MGPTVQIWGEQGSFGNYVRAIETAGGRGVLARSWIQDCDALVLPGGGDMEPWRYGQKNTASRNLEPERDEEELWLLERFTALKRPVLGICRGMQTINVFFGGTLIQDLPGHSAVKGMDRFHKVSTAPSFLSEICGESRAVNSAHHQALDCLGSGVEAAQWAPDGTVEALCHRYLPVWAVQWHPERLPGQTGEKLFRTFLALCKP